MAVSHSIQLDDDFPIGEEFTLKKSDRVKFDSGLISRTMDHARPGRALLTFLADGIATFAQDEKGRNKYPDVLNEAYLSTHLIQNNKNISLFTYSYEFKHDHKLDPEEYKASVFHPKFRKVFKKIIPIDQRRLENFIYSLFKKANDFVYDEKNIYQPWIPQFLGIERLKKAERLHGANNIRQGLAYGLLFIMGSAYHNVPIGDPCYGVYRAIPFFIQKINSTIEKTRTVYSDVYKKMSILSAPSPVSFPDEKYDDEKQLIQWTRYLLNETKSIVENIKHHCEGKLLYLKARLKSFNAIYAIRSNSFILYKNSIITLLDAEDTSKKMLAEDYIEWIEKATWCLTEYYNMQKTPYFYTKEILAALNSIPDSKQPDIEAPINFQHVERVINLAKTMESCEKTVAKIPNDFQSKSIIKRHAETCIEDLKEGVEPKTINKFIAQVHGFSKLLYEFEKEVIKLLNENDRKIILSRSYLFLRIYLKERLSYFLNLLRNPMDITIVESQEIIRITLLISELNSLRKAGKESIGYMQISKVAKELYCDSLEIALNLLQNPVSSKRTEEIRSLSRTLQLCTKAINDKNERSLTMLESHAREIAGKSDFRRKLLGTICVLGAAIGIILGLGFAIPSMGTSAAIGLYSAYALLGAAGIYFFKSGMQHGLSKKVSSLTTEIKQVSHPNY